jgi:molybdopterin-guanine dinucleotide biosynthesis protein A
METRLTDKSEMAAVILAGGKSARMKMDKALLPVSGVPLIEKIARDLEPHFSEIIVCADSAAKYDFLPYRVVEDEEPGMGPLMGILSGLRASTRPLNFVMACDIPEIDIFFIERLKSYATDYDIVVPLTGERLMEPLFAFYKRTVIPKIEKLLKQGVRKVIKLYNLCTVKYVPMQNTEWFYNLNTDEDYERYLKGDKRGKGTGCPG